VCVLLLVTGRNRTGINIGKSVESIFKVYFGFSVQMCSPGLVIVQLFICCQFVALDFL
jgi:hypothetical protein